MNLIKHIPEGWQLVELGDLVDTLADYTANGSFASLKENVTYYNEPNYAVLVRTTDLKKKKFIPERFTDQKGYEYLKKSALYGGEILMANVGSIGEVYIVPEYDQPMTLAPNMYLIKYKQSLDNTYAYYYMNSSFFIKQLLSKIASTTLQAVNKTNFKSIQIPLPPHKEQKQIAEILSTVDQKIDSIDTKLEETQTLKRGLMQRLLSEGIGHSEFKESEIGRIPTGWNYQTFEEAKIQIIDGDRGTNYPKQHDFFQEGFCLFLSAKNVTKRGFEFIEKQFITEEKDSLLRKGKLTNYDIVLTTRGTVGNIAYFDNSVPFENIRINSGMVLIRVRENLDSKYLYKIMTSELIQNKIQNIAFGSAQPQLTVKEIKNFKIPVPTLEEQKQIAQILATTDEKLESLRAKKEAFETLKKGLMQKLLGGEVRVMI